jgi:hypothetical protein
MKLTFLPFSALAACFFLSISGLLLGGLSAQSDVCSDSGACNYLAVEACYYTGCNVCSTDLDQDGVVGGTDLLMFLADFGRVCLLDAEPDSSSWGQLVITEIHYNPAGTQGPDSQFEFLEIHNPGLAVIALEGWSLNDGLSFVFPSGAIITAGDFLVLCPDSMTYAGLGYPVYEWLSGGINNSGETVVLRAPDQTVIDFLTYSDYGEWPTEPDGHGPSMELYNVLWDNALGASWGGSIDHGGTPGAVNSLWLD